MHRKTEGQGDFECFQGNPFENNPTGPLPHLQAKGQPGNQAIPRLTAGPGSLPFLEEPRSQPGLQPRSESPSSRLHFSLPLLSGSRAPQTGFLPRLSPAGGAPGPRPYLRLPPGPCRPLQPSRRYTPFRHRKRRGRRAAGSCGKKQSGLHS